MRTYEDYLPERRFYELAEIINSSRSLKEGYYLCKTTDGFEVSVTHEFHDEVEFVDGSKLFIKERYFLERRALLIKYVYIYRNANGLEIFRCDNSPHHPDVWTFPHHKHYVHTDRIYPFSGGLADFISEIERY